MYLLDQKNFKISSLSSNKTNDIIKKLGKNIIMQKIMQYKQY